MTLRTLPTPSLLTAIAVLGSGLAACGDDPASPEDTLPAPTGQAVWEHLQEADYQTEWALWPGTTERGEVLDALGPPHTALSTIRVNPVASLALQLGLITLPTGAIVVKENYSIDETLESITTMYKYPNYDPPYNDWFWLENDPSGEILSAGTVEGCTICHQGAEPTDYLWTLLRQ